MVVAVESPAGHLDPRSGTDQTSERLFDLYLRGLVALEPDGGLGPDLARSWEILDGGLRWRFRLDPEARFHDGRPLEATDVAWTFNSILDGTVVTPKRGSLESLRRVVPIGDHTVDFVLSEPWGALLASLTSGLGIVPRGTTPEDTAAHPVGSGPFRILDHRPDVVTLGRWDGSWREKPFLPRIVLRAVPDATVRALELEKGTVHLVVNGLAPDAVPRFRTDPAFRVVDGPGSNYAYLGLNLRDPILADRRVRRALALAIDRATLVEAVWRGLGDLTETLVPPGHWARHPSLPPIPHDPGVAASLLDEAGYRDPDGEGPLPRFTLEYSTSTNATSLLQAQAIQAMLGRIGIEVRIRSFEFATFYADIKRGDFQMFSLVWTGISDPDIYRYVLHSESVPPHGANRGGYANPAFDRLVEIGARGSTPEQRRPAYLRAQEILARDLPYVSLFTKRTVAVLPRILEGYESYPSGELHALAGMRWRDDSTD